jgi:hypothetical protein
MEAEVRRVRKSGERWIIGLGTEGRRPSWRIEDMEGKARKRTRKNAPGQATLPFATHSTNTSPASLTN